MLRVDIEPLLDGPVRVEATLRALPGLRTMSCTSSPFRMQRTREIVAGSDDGFGLVVNFDARAEVCHRGHEVGLRAGDGATITNAAMATFTHSGARHVGLIVPRAAVAPMVADLEDAAGRLIPRDNEALRLLLSYLRSLQEDVPLASAELLGFSATHVHDLFALALGATRDGAAVAQRRGLRAARLRAIKADIARNLASETLSIGWAAARQRVTPRYVQMLFESDGATFSQFVLDRRLERARALLTQPGSGARTISAIAFEAGFGDLSYFNRTFRRRYGITPSELRNGERGTLG